MERVLEASIPAYVIRKDGINVFVAFARTLVELEFILKNEFGARFSVGVARRATWDGYFIQAKNRILRPTDDPETFRAKGWALPGDAVCAGCSLATLDGFEPLCRSCSRCSECDHSAGCPELENSSH